MKKNYLDTLNINDKNAADRLLDNLADLSKQGLDRLKQVKYEADLLAEYNRRAMALQISIDNYYYDYCDILRLAIKSTAPVTHLVVPDYNDELFFEPLGIYLDNGDMCFIYHGLYYKGHGTSDEISRTLQNAVNTHKLKLMAKKRISTNKQNRWFAFFLPYIWLMKNYYLL